MIGVAKVRGTRSKSFGACTRLEQEPAFSRGAARRHAPAFGQTRRSRRTRIRFSAHDGRKRLSCNRATLVFRIIYEGDRSANALSTTGNDLVAIACRTPG
jgi:hypothetical protein